jgi:hypothetical protein
MVEWYNIILILQLNIINIKIYQKEIEYEIEREVVHGVKSL